MELKSEDAWRNLASWKIGLDLVFLRRLGKHSRVRTKLRADCPLGMTLSRTEIPVKHSRDAEIAIV